MRIVQRHDGTVETDDLQVRNDWLTGTGRTVAAGDGRVLGTGTLSCRRKPGKK